jgi:hypothetical protein
MHEKKILKVQFAATRYRVANPNSLVRALAENSEVRIPWPQLFTITSAANS